METRSGLIQVYTGDGKGKTTAALGLALRALGRGWRVKVFQFMKAPQSSGEHFSAGRLAPELEIIPVGRRGFIRDGRPDSEDIRLAQEGFDRARRAVLDRQSDLVILDELAVALHFNLVAVDQVLELFRHRPAEVELVITGRGIPEEILAQADLVTEMRAVKHPYQAGVLARQGIEY